MFKITSPSASLYCSTGLGAAVLPVSSFVCRYPLNGIPSATVVVPGGYEFTHMLQGMMLLSPVHSIAPAPDSMPFAQLSVGGVPLLTGYVTGASQSVADSHLSYAIDISHWLITLSTFSPTDPSLSPLNPRFLAAKAVEAGAPHPALELVPSAPAVGLDIWEAITKPFLLGAAAIWGSQVHAAALSSMYSAVPLVLEPSLAMAVGNARNLIYRVFSHPSAEGYVGANCLQLLTRVFCPLFSLDIAPAVNKVYLAPALEICTTPVIAYSGSQCLSVEPRTGFQLPIAGCAVFSRPVVVKEDENVVASQPIVAWKQWRSVGRLVLREAPPLLDELGVCAVEPVNTDIVNTFADNKKAKTQDGRASQKMLVGRVNPAVYLASAEAELFQELFRGRSVGVRLGPMSFTACMAPGSTIEVIPTTLGLPSILGRVRETVIVGDSINGDFHVEYVLTGCRTLSENMQLALDGIVHPYYGNSWAGAALVS